MDRTTSGLGAAATAALFATAIAGCGLVGGNDSRPPAEVLEEQIANAVEATGTDQVAALTIGIDRRSGWVTLWDGPELVRYDLDDETSEVVSQSHPWGSMPAAELDLPALVTFADDVTCTETDEAALIEATATAAGSLYVGAFCGEADDPLKQTVDGEEVPDLDDFLTVEALDVVLEETRRVAGDGLTELSIYPEFGEVVIHGAPMEFGDEEGELRLSRFLSGEGDMTGLDLPGSSYREPSGDPVFQQADVPAQNLLDAVDAGVQEAGADPGTPPFQVSVGADENGAVVIWVIMADGDEPVRLDLDGTVLS